MRCSSAFLFSQWAVDLIVDEVCNVNHDMSWMSRLAMQQDSIQMSFNSCDVGIWHVLNFPCYAASFNLTFSLWAPSCKEWVNSVHEMSLSCDVMHVEMRTPVDDRGMHLRFWDSKKMCSMKCAHVEIMKDYAMSEAWRETMNQQTMCSGACKHVNQGFIDLHCRIQRWCDVHARTCESFKPA